VNPGPYKRTIGAINGAASISHMNEPQASSQKIRPSRWFYLIALGLIAVGTICAYKIVAAAINTMQGGLTRAIFPGETVVSFSTPGDYEIYVSGGQPQAGTPAATISISGTMALPK